MKRSTKPMKRGKPMARKRMVKKAAPPGFPEEVRMAARKRSGGVCEVGSTVCSGPPVDHHHRKLRRHGDHSLANCLFACDPCHDYIHEEVTLSRLMGWLVPSWMEPTDVPVKRGERYRKPQH